MQIDMFRSSDLNILISRMDMLEKSLDKVRKGMFARLTNTDKHAIETRDILEEVSKDIYKIKTCIYTQEEKIIPIEKQA